MERYDAPGAGPDGARAIAPVRDGYRWSPVSRRAFLEALALDGNVRNAASVAGFSHASAYQERQRNRDFAYGWDAALVLARDTVEQVLYDRALHGSEEAIYYHGEVTATRTRFYPHLLLALLARLDQRAQGSQSRRGAARFGDVLDAVAAGRDAAPLFNLPLPEEEDWFDPMEPVDDIGFDDLRDGHDLRDEPEQGRVD